MRRHLIGPVVVVVVVAVTGCGLLPLGQDARDAADEQAILDDQVRQLAAHNDQAEDEVRAVMALEDAIDALYARLERDFDEVWAGGWVDHGGGRSTVHVAFTDPPDRAVVAGRFPDPARLVIHDVRFTMAELDLLMDAISADADMWHAQGLDLVLWAPDPERNQVVVELFDGGEGSEQRTAMLDHYATDALRVELVDFHINPV